MLVPLGCPRKNVLDRMRCPAQDEAMPWRLNDDPQQYRQRTRSLLEVRSLGHPVQLQALGAEARVCLLSGRVAVAGPSRRRPERLRWW